MTVTLLVLAAVLAVGDWVAVDRGALRWEYLLKPGVLLALGLAALAADLGDPKPLVVTALALGLVGDVALVLAGHRDAGGAFYTGLVAFLLGHVAYVVAFVVVGLHLPGLLVGALIAAVIGGVALPGVLRRTARTGRLLPLAVGGYSLAVAATAAGAAGTRHLVLAVGGVLFVVSDAVLARERFATPLPRSPLVVAVTYHLAQFLLLVGLLGAAA
ncbi:YhhN-like protein [Jatrophihabitans endophyticus]|uniref:YhhN-like protein n=1 Tax=Jatrophihabitans endophyticus TaxID=1206085 RepID=A0A1M5GJ48_9ACTN|nr:lysoplasmalogenase family protein [Jatrophihabitans endophyticus]SHG03747.1 YhhN-like protein [Jatrophihabitans endophyticus]